MDSAIQSDHRMKIKEYEKIKKYLDLARELTKVWTIKVTLILIGFSALGTPPKEPEKETREMCTKGWIKTTALLKSA